MVTFKLLHNPSNQHLFSHYCNNDTISEGKTLQSCSICHLFHMTSYHFTFISLGYVMLCCFSTHWQDLPLKDISFWICFPNSFLNDNDNLSIFIHIFLNDNDNLSIFILIFLNDNDNLSIFILIMLFSRKIEALK